MKIQNKYIAGFLIGGILFAIAILLNAIANKYNFVFFGKDNGLLFRAFFTCLATGCICFWIRKKVSYFFIGFFIGVGAFIITFLIYLIISEVFKKDNSGWDTPLLLDQFIVTAIIVFIIIKMIIKNIE